MPDKDAFDQWWEWANPVFDHRTIPAEIYEAVLALPPDEWHESREGQRCGT